MVATMIAALKRPLTPGEVGLLTAAVAGAVAIYCVGYTALAGQPEPLGEALAWALINVAPWIPALELAKRARSWLGVSGALVLGFGLSLALGLIALSSLDGAAFEAWRRVPALAAMAALAAAIRWKQGREAAAAHDDTPLPLLPRQIDWVQAAGNYIELRASGRTVVHRSSIGAAERDLADHGFVRIHRSTLVRRDRIARVRPHDVILADGTHLKVGKRYRATLHR